MIETTLPLEKVWMTPPTSTTPWARRCAHTHEVRCVRRYVCAHTDDVHCVRFFSMCVLTPTMYTAQYFLCVCSHPRCTLRNIFSVYVHTHDVHCVIFSLCMFTPTMYVAYFLYVCAHTHDVRCSKKNNYGCAHTLVVRYIRLPLWVCLTRAAYEQV